MVRPSRGRVAEAARTGFAPRRASGISAGRTEKAYVSWARRFIVFHGKRHPASWDGAELAGVPLVARDDADK
jgi:hypothetical protein